MQVPLVAERYVPDFDGHRSYEQLHRYALAFGLARDLDVLDVLSGEGYGTAYLAAVARSVVGVDVDGGSVRRAAARYTGMNLTFRLGSCVNIPLPDQSVDLVTSFETIEHIHEREQLVREIVRVLRPNGKLMMSAPNRLLSDEDNSDNDFPIRALYFDELRDLLRDCFRHCRLYGQRIIAVSAIHPLRGLAKQARCVSPATHEGEQGLPALPVPASFVAICSRADPDSSLAMLDSVFVDPRDDLLLRVVTMQSASARTSVSYVKGEPVEYVPAMTSIPDRRTPDGRSTVRSAEGDLLRHVLAMIFGHDDAVPPDLSEAATSAEDIVQAAFDERERATVRLVELRAEVADQHARLIAAEAAVHDERERATVRLAELQAELADRDARLTAAEARNERFACNAETLRADVFGASQRIAELTARQEQVIRERDALLSDRERLRKELDVRNVSAANANSEQRALASEIRRLKQAFEQLESAHRNDALFAGQAAELAAGLELESRELRTRLDDALRERDEARAELDRLLTSRSWRITKPLRLVRQSFRDI